MPVLIIILAAQVAFAVHGTPVQACRAKQLRLSVDDRNGEFNAMSHSGTALAIHNVGPDCALASLPIVQFRNARGRLLPAVRQTPIGMRLGPAGKSLRIAAGHRASTTLRWISGPVFSHSRSLHASFLTVQIDSGSLRTKIRAVLVGEGRSSAKFDQPVLGLMEGMAER